MVRTSRLISSGGPATYLGHIVLAGSVDDDVPVVPPARVLDHWVVSVLHEGRGHYLDDRSGRTPLRPGSVLIIRPGLSHWYGTENNETWTETWVILAGPLFDLLEPQVQANGPAYHVRPESAGAVLASLRHPPRGMREGEQQVTELFAELVDVVSRADSGRSSKIQTAVDLLSADGAADLRMTDVAEQVGLDYDVFRHQFTREVGQSPSAFRAERRIRAAANLLRMTTMTHRAIARELGYADEFHFSRRFSAAFGVSPSAYRRRH